VDDQIGNFGGSRAVAARLGDEWGIGRGGVQTVSDILLGLVCLSLAVVLVRTSLRRRRGDVPSQGPIGILGTSLVICGLAQLVGVVVAAPAGRRSATPLLAAVACWAAALTLRRPAGRAKGTASTPTADDSDSPDLAGQQRLEEALRLSEAQVRQLAEADAHKNEFLAMLGHELRNPLAPIRNALRIMKRRGLADPDLCWARDVVEHQLHQLGRLVNDLQEISRVTNGKIRLQKEPVDVATLVAFAVETSRPSIDANHHRLAIALPPGPVLVEVDAIRMAQVLSNLLNNAAKYTKTAGQIRLAVAIEKAEVVFRVRDNGIGIAPEMVSRIFDRFAQADHALDRAQGGLGLGLSLVRSLVEMHGGTVQARSDGLDRGSEFIVRLPRLPAAAATAKPRAGARAELVREPEPDPEPEPESAPEAVMSPSRQGPPHPEPPDRPARRVLVVDDDPTSAQSMAMILKLEGYLVQVAYDGEAALEAVRSFRPEAVLMDIGLPGIDGHEVARRLRQDPDLASGLALLAAVTGHAEAEARRRSREAGFDHHLVKPVDPDAVLALLDSLPWVNSH
jgi:signal transduction histidine kinase